MWANRRCSILFHLLVPGGAALHRALVNAQVRADNVVIGGTLTGEVTCRHLLEILPTGRLSGTIMTGSIVIQEGAKRQAGSTIPASASHCKQEGSVAIGGVRPGAWYASGPAVTGVPPSGR